jgi:hypothetical protein
LEKHKLHSHLNFLRRKIAFRATNWLHRINSLADTPKGGNVMLVTVRHELAETQIYPFHFYREILATKHGVECAQIGVDAAVADAAMAKPLPQHWHIKRVFFQAAFEMPGVQMVQALQHLTQVYQNARIAFMDWYAPLQIRPAIHVDPYIDIYVKKQTYADFANYGRPTLGDTKLNDYYARRHSLPDAPQQFDPPQGLEKKIRLGSNFSMSPLMIDLFLDQFSGNRSRDIDLHSRIAVNGVRWYKAMRQEAKGAVQKLQGVKVVSGGRLRRHKFYAEMQRSKLCFSRFGYGEVWSRDYEAHATGALLLKPDMSHLRVLPDVFLPIETYVPLKWDLSDFGEKVEYYLHNHDARSQIVRQGFEVNAAWIKSQDYVGTIAGLCR